MKNGILHVDVTKTYPEGKEIYFQDIADVKYIPLETTDDFLCSGSPV